MAFSVTVNATKERWLSHLVSKLGAAMYVPMATSSYAAKQKRKRPTADGQDVTRCAVLRRMS